jgi:hypothetical protein
MLLNGLPETVVLTIDMLGYTVKKGAQRVWQQAVD